MKNKTIWSVIIPIALIVVLVAIPTFVVLSRMGVFRSEPTAAVIMAAPEDAPELVFVADYDFDPYSFLNEDGTPNGMDVEIAYELANRLGMRPRIEFGTWSECKQKIKNGSADVLLGLEIFVDGSGTGTLKSIPVGTDTLSIIGRDSVPDAAALSGKRVGVSFGSALMGLFNLNCEYVEYFTYSEMLEALDKGEIEYGICHASVASKIIKKNGYSLQTSLVLMESFPTMGIRQDEPELLEQINRQLENMSSDGTIAALREKWIVTNVQNTTIGDVLHNNEGFFIVYCILAIILLSLYFIAAVSYRASVERKKSLETVQAQQKSLEKALDIATKEQLRTSLLHDMIHSGKWSFYVDAEDKLIGGSVSSEANALIRNDVPADGKSWLNIVHPDDKENAYKAFWNSIKDHSCNTPYDVNYRMEGRNGMYRWFHSAGRMIRNKDGSGEFFGIHVDITDQMEEQQRRLLGAVPLSNDVLNKANIGLWAFELDDGQAPRMYGDEAMLRLVGLDHQVTPEEMYHAWYDRIDERSYQLVTDAVNKMASGEHAEVQYPWHHPDGSIMIVRCGGVRNPEYTKGIRIEGTHQDVTQTLHYDEKAARQRRLELEAAKVRAEMLAFISDNEPDIDRFMEFFGKRVLEVTGCDQVIFRSIEDHRIVVNAEGIEDVPQSICSECRFSEFRSDDYADNGTVRMDDCAKGCCGMKVHPGCPAKSSYMEKVYSGDKLTGLLTVHYMKDRHEFTDSDIDIMKTVGTHLGFLLMRIEAKRAELEKLKAESASAAKTDFLFNMSHDIRTPINAIIGFTNIAKKEIDHREKALDSLEKVQTSSDILLNLINDVLDMSRIESGEIELHEEPCEITEVFDSFEPAMAGLAASKDIDLQFRIETIRDRFIFVDGPRFDRVFINIVSNAIKYTPAEGSVRVTAEQIEDTAPGYGNYRFTVSDNGIGISEEFQKHMYENFSREYNPTTREVQGTGLGLALAKRIVDLMGGTISCISAQGTGTTFTMVFPFRLQTAADMAEKTNEKQDRIKIDLRGKKALLVEDNELNREIAEEILSTEGITVETAVNGQNAVDKVKELGADHYDFILMDIQMPVMNGYEAAKEIRKLYPEAGLPIIALSANAFAEDKKKALEAGMNDHVAKPIDVKELMTALAKFL